MKHTYKTLMILSAIVLLTLVSCKKDDNSDKTPDSAPLISEPEKDLFSATEHMGIAYGHHNNGTPTIRENVANAEINFKATMKWIDGDNSLSQAYNTFWFEMFDEPWKLKEPKGVGPSWGLYTANGTTKPKFTILPLF